MLALSVMLHAGCRGDVYRATASATDGDPTRGAQALRTYGCSSCHVIPGVPGAVSQVGPPLTDVGERSYLAGELSNTPDNMVRWIRYPRTIKPHTAMPDTGVTEVDGRDMAAYLYALR